MLFSSLAAADVNTPSGPRPASSVTQVDSGQVISAASRARARALLQGGGPTDIRDQDQGSSPKSNLKSNEDGWITYSYWNVPQGSAIEKLTSRWQVPPAPLEKGGQLLYLFNSLVNAESTTILQPVLQWGISDAGGGEYWGVASWFVDLNGQTYHTPLVRVEPGQILSGTITHLNSTSKSTPGSLYVSQFDGIPGTTLVMQNIETLTLATETLEAYTVDDCLEYPHTRSTAFTGIDLVLSGNSAPLDWTGVNRVSNCGQHASLVSDSMNNGEVDLFYSP